MGEPDAPTTRLAPHLHKADQATLALPLSLVIVCLALFVLLSPHALALDVVAPHPTQGDQGAYEGYEATWSPEGVLLENRSIEHTREWTQDPLPLTQDTSDLPTLLYRFPTPSPRDSNPSQMIDNPLDLSNRLLAASEEGPAVTEQKLTFAARYETLPGPPSAFSIALLDKHQEDAFWRVFRLHTLADDWCARAPIGSILNLPPDQAHQAATECLAQAPWGQTRSVDTTARTEHHPRWGPSWAFEGTVTYETKHGTGQATIELRTTPRASLPLEQTLTRREPGPSGPTTTTQHLELTGYRHGEGAPITPGNLPTLPSIQQVLWTPDGPQEAWDPGLAIDQARQAAHDNEPTYWDDEPNANLTYAMHLVRHRDERSTPATAAVAPGKCTNPHITPPSQPSAIQETGWMLFYSGTDEDLIALVDTVDDRASPVPLDDPPRTQTTRIASAGENPGLSLPREGPSPQAMYEHSHRVDALDAEGDPYIAIFPPSQAASTDIAETEPLLGAIGRMGCTLDPVIGAYRYEDAGIVFHKGETSGVYTLRVEAIDQQALAPGDLPPPPMDASTDPSTLKGAGLASLTLAATGMVGWVGTRALGTFYSRIRDRDILDNQTRRRIHDRVHAAPGVHLSDLASGFDEHRSTISYHLDRLEQAQLVETRVTNSGTVAFPPDHPLIPHADVIARGKAQALMTAVEDAPGLHLGAYADELGVATSYVSRLASELEEAGLLERQRDGRRLLISPGPQLRSQG